MLPYAIREYVFVLGMSLWPYLFRDLKLDFRWLYAMFVIMKLEGTLSVLPYK